MKKPLVGVNDITTTHPNILKEWNYKKNNKSPEHFSYGSGIKVWWICNRGHEWQDEIRARIKGNGCPYCSGHRVLAGFNDLTTTHPDIVKEWDHMKNGKKKPEDYSKGSREKVSWICKYGHSWEAYIYHRTKGEGCPICNRVNQTSFAEQAIYYYISKVYNNTINRYKDIFSNGMELDIYIPDKKIGIEYDGVYYHDNIKSESREKIKYNICKENDIILIRIKEKKENKPNISDYVIYCNWASGKYNDLDAALKKLFEYINIKVEVDSKKDKDCIMKLYKSKLKENSLATNFPELIKEWDYENNNGLTPDMFTSSSGISIKWKCNKGHKFEAKICKRTKNQGCPYCSNKKVLTGYNDLASLYPDLLEEWDYDNNKDVEPTNISAGSSKKVYWKCNKGHEWRVSICKRTSGHKCPYCTNKLVKQGYNDIFTLRPELKKEWDFDENVNIDPYKTSIGSAKKNMVEM